ncbi:MAG: hypothetical protein MK137_07255 [Rickettsiales bacterium]|nr:hypothetical protein [Rickettsiales bacterium]
MAQFLAEGRNIEINTHIVSVTRDAKWCLWDKHNTHYDSFDWVISTVPAPQVADLFPQSFSWSHKVAAINMMPCIALMLGFSSPLPLEFDAAHVTNSDISWIAVNSNKPERSNHYTLMVHSSDAFAQKHIDDDLGSVVIF